MILENVKPLLIVWLPITDPLSTFLTKQPSLNLSSLGPSWLNEAVGYIQRKTTADKGVIGYIPIPFYFYERLLGIESNSDEAAGFLLDDVSENIAVSYPETPTASTPGSTKATVLTIRNTIELSFRVKLGSTIVSILRFLLKRVMTDYETAKNIRFSFYWREYALSACKLCDYNETPATGTDLTILRMKLETFKPGEPGAGAQTASTGGEPLPTNIGYSLK